MRYVSLRAIKNKKGDIKMNKWYKNSGNESDVVISSRVRLARNIPGYAFPARLDNDKSAEIISKVVDAASCAGLDKINFSELEQHDKAKYVERHLVSPAFMAPGISRALLVSDDESLSVMINEEDHLRIQSMGAGLCLAECMTAAAKLDALLDSRLSFSFSGERGYITSCPTNLGCAMRLSVMLHLPALTETGNIKGIISAAAKLGLTVRGIYGEGSEATSSIYQISNALSLGSTETELLERLNSAVSRIITMERKLRRMMYDRNNMAYSDRIWRAYGTLTSARIISSKEAMKLLGEVRLASSIDNSDLPKIDTAVLNSLIMEIQPNTMGQQKAGSRDADRAKLIRECIR